MTITTKYTIVATVPPTPPDLIPDTVDLVFEPIASTVTIEPYATKVTMTIGSTVYTIDSADLRELVRSISGT